jgi:hypothetical protein
MDGARFANAVAHLGCDPAALTVNAGVDALTFGCVKNGGMSAEALVCFDPALADMVRYRRKRAGHLQSKGRYLAAQVLAMIEDGLWLENARAANAAAATIGEACDERLLHPVEANEVFAVLSPTEQAALHAQGFDFYDWPASKARPARRGWLPHGTAIRRMSRRWPAPLPRCDIARRRAGLVLEPTHPGPFALVALIWAPPGWSSRIRSGRCRPAGRSPGALPWPPSACCCWRWRAVRACGWTGADTSSPC